MLGAAKAASPRNATRCRYIMGQILVPRMAERESFPHVAIVRTARLGKSHVTDPRYNAGPDRHTIFFARTACKARLAISAGRYAPYRGVVSMVTCPTCRQVIQRARPLDFSMNGSELHPRLPISTSVGQHSETNG
jgi:hypothetical protein